MTGNGSSRLHDAVDALLAAVAAGAVLPAPAERVRLREAAGLTQAAVAQALGTRVPSLEAWEAGRSEPKAEKLEAYRRLLEGLAERFPPPAPASPGNVDLTGPDLAVSGLTGLDPVASRPAVVDAVTPAPCPAEPESESRAGQSATGRAAAPWPAARPVADTRTHAEPQFADGPLLVVDGDGTAYGIGGLVLECPAKTIGALVEWALTRARIGSPRLHPSGKDGDPLVVLTASAAERFKLPDRLADRAGLRLPEDHPVLKQLAKSDWMLTRRGLGPWARIYRPATSGRRQCVQLAILPWDALDVRAWGEDAATLPAPQIAQMLGTYAQRVITPVGGAAVCGTELMTALRPPTHAVRGDDGSWRSAALPGSLPIAVDPAPPEPPSEHPLAAGRPEGPAGALDEEALAWFRDAELLTDAECALPFAVGVDVNTAFLAAASRLRVGLGEPVHIDRPVFDPKLCGSWLVDLSDLVLDPRLPSPFTPTGETPEGPAWYATPTVAYAVELATLLGQPLALRPFEAWLYPDESQLRALESAYGLKVPPAPWERRDPDQLERLGLAAVLDPDGPAGDRLLRFLGTVPRFAAGPYLDPWYTRLRDAYLATMADLGVTTDLDPAQYLAAMEHHKQTNPAAAAVLSAIKATVKGGVGKLRERPQGRGYSPGRPWAALQRPTWRPGIRAQLIAKNNTNLHRKIMNLALKADLYPLAVNVDCVLYASSGPSPLDVLPYDAAGKPLAGGFRLGVSPGMVKHEGTRELVWAAQLMDEGRNPARLVKGPDAVWDGE